MDQIKALSELMVANDLSEIVIREGESKIELRRGFAPAAPPAFAYAAPPPAAAASVAAPAPGAATAPAADASLGAIVSPMVGTFYAAPEPDAPPFVRAGDRVGPDTVVCIIEAMKVFNEIKAEIAGIVETVEIQSGQPVEYGQTLFKVRTG